MLISKRPEVQHTKLRDMTMSAQVHGHDFACLALLPSSGPGGDPGLGSGPASGSGSDGQSASSLKRHFYVSGSEEKVLRVLEAPQAFLDTLAAASGQPVGDSAPQVSSPFSLCSLQHMCVMATALAEGGELCAAMQAMPVLGDSWSGCCSCSSACRVHSLPGGPGTMPRSWQSIFHSTLRVAGHTPCL